jgi:hypothetical protein
MRPWVGFGGGRCAALGGGFCFFVLFIIPAHRDASPYRRLDVRSRRGGLGGLC